VPNQIPSALSFGLEHARNLITGKQVLLLSGAGISTDSGIPDYRGAGRIQKHPLTFDQFMGSPQNQARYWARSYVGWGRIAGAEPNDGHFAVARAEEAKKIFQVITQNVDGLHQKAGAKNVLELHGRLDTVVCVQCGELIQRSELDLRISQLNPDFVQDPNAEASPDGDAEIEVDENFKVPSCGVCGGNYKPDVVFFGEQIPKSRVLKASEAVEAAEAIVVAGSSLTVNSGLRLVKRGKELGLPIVIVNLGETKADSIADVRLNVSTSKVLAELFDV
jgi:NAD-dependent SIR2 family protein deacetylase